MRESAYLKRIAAALRPQSVNADELTPEEIIDQWQPNLDPIDMMGDYGDTTCACGHPIKYVYEVYNILNGERYSPIGSVCICKAFSVDKSEITLYQNLYEVFKAVGCRVRFDRSKPSLDAELVSKENGFNKRTMEWIRLHIPAHMMDYLSQLYRQRKTVHAPTDNQRRFLYVIAQRILTEIHNDRLKRRQNLKPQQ